MTTEGKPSDWFIGPDEGDSEEVCCQCERTVIVIGNVGQLVHGNQTVAGDVRVSSQLRTGDAVREELRRKGVSVTEWSLANGFSPNLVFEVLAGRRNPQRGMTRRIAVALGMKAGEIEVNPADALKQSA